METGLFRFSQNKDYTKEEIYSSTLTSLFITSLSFIILVLIFYENIAQLLDYANNPEYIFLLGITVGLDAFSAIPFAELRIRNKAKRFASVKLINIGLNIGLNLFFLLFCPLVLGEDNIVFQYLYPKLDVGYIFISYFITSVITLFILSPEVLSVFKKFTFNKQLLRRMFKYSLPLMVAGLAGMTSETLDRILLKYMIVVPEGIQNTGEYIMGEIGIYGANLKIAILMVLFIQAFRYAAEPFFFNYSKNTDSKELYAKVMKYFIIFGLFVFIGITLFIDIVKWMIDTSYHEGLYIIPILLLSKLFFGIIFNLSIWYKLTNLTKYGAILAFSGAFVSVILNIILIPKYGYLGSAWASFFAYLLMMILSFLLGKRYYKIKYDLLNIFIYFIIALLIYLLNIVVRELMEYYIIINVLLIISFVLIVIKKEKISIKSLNILKW
ncbi:MAG: lipopolysaccharide biosynthesis protein [Bacteroidetes bacterium]|nr:MAG: lipopolysaccharide biosynthesis protein [Bacteroidota bacterium]